MVPNMTRFLVHQLTTRRHVRSLCVVIMKEVDATGIVIFFVVIVVIARRKPADYANNLHLACHYCHHHRDDRDDKPDIFSLYRAQTLRGLFCQ